MDKDIWTDEELRQIDTFRKDLIEWMFHRPSESYPIETILKRAIKYGKKNAKAKKCVQY